LVLCGFLPPFQSTDYRLSSLTIFSKLLFINQID
jgi:hypothetical protein